MAQNPNLVAPGDMPRPLNEVGFDQHLGDKLPLDAGFVDEFGQQVTLGDYFGERPVLVTFVYYDCPMLCSLILNGLVKALGVLKFNAGQEFEVVVISFAPEETPEMALETRQEILHRYDRSETDGGWHFLTGPEESIRRVTEAAGFRFTYLPENGEYAHAGGIMVATSDGTLAQYYYGIEYPPKDLRLALVEASANKIGSVVDQLLLYCYRYDPTLGRYTAIVTRVIRLAGIVFCIALAAFLWIMFRHEPVSDRKPTLGAA